MGRFVNPKSQYADGNNVLIPGGQLFFFVSGSAGTIPADTYSDPDLQNRNTNPVILGADARVPDIWLDDDVLYQVVLRTPGNEFNPEGVQVWEVDPVGTDTGTGQLEDWSPSRPYDTGDYVQGSDGNLYEAIQPSTGRDPISEPQFWSQVFFNKVWNVNETYVAGDFVYHNGREFRSRTGGNLGNDPDLSNEWLATSYEADGALAAFPALTFDGYGISTDFTRPSTGVLRITFDKPATGTEKQNVEVEARTPNGTDIYQAVVEYVNETTVEVTNFFVNVVTGEWAEQNNSTPISIRRTLFE